MLIESEVTKGIKILITSEHMAEILMPFFDFFYI